MKNSFFLTMLIIVLFGLVKSVNFQQKSEDLSNVFIAHAGGLVDDYAGTNSLEALKESVKHGYKYIEVDIIKTTDNKYVLAHDWEHMYNRVPLAVNAPVAQDTFVDYKIDGKYTAVTLEALLEFLDENPDVFIITDTKYNDYSSIEHIAEKYSEYKSRFIPQVYLFDDYNYIKSLGFDKVITTVYGMPQEIKLSPEKIAAKAISLNVYAVSIPDELLQDPTYVKALKLNRITYFAHTINSVERAEELFNAGIKGVYTDKIKPETNNAELFSYITEYSSKYTNRINILNNTISILSEQEKALLNDCLIYELGSEILINKGVAELIYKDSNSNCFKDRSLQDVYLPFNKTAESLGATNLYYIQDKGIYEFEYDGYFYKLPTYTALYEKIKDGQSEIININNETVIYRDYIFATEMLYESLFNCEIIKLEDRFIIVTSQKTSLESDYAEIIEKLLKEMSAVDKRISE